MTQDKEPHWTIQGNLLCNRPRSVDYSEAAKHQVDANLLYLWEELTFLEKIWLVASYPFRRNK